jgi:hypothetical protein
MEAINDMWALKVTCREAFECSKSAPSATQQQVSETLRLESLNLEKYATTLNKHKNFAYCSTASES